MRRPIIAMNLKNYINTNRESEELFKALTTKMNLLENSQKIDVFLLPSLGNMHVAKDSLQDTDIRYGSQNIAPSKNGPFTGEYSIESLVEIGGSLVEIGHYERITLFKETPVLINQKIKLTLDEQLIPLICIGSEEDVLVDEAFRTYITKQLTNYFENIGLDANSDIILAYEPAWAIGQKEAAPVELVHKNHQIIRSVLSELFGEDVAEKIRLIYGGSVSKENAKSLVSSEDVDGLFIGRFGHDPENFKDIAAQILTIKMR